MKENSSVELSQDNLEKALDYFGIKKKVSKVENIFEKGHNISLGKEKKSKSLKKGIENNSLKIPRVDELIKSHSKLEKGLGVAIKNFTGEISGLDKKIDHLFKALESKDKEIHSLKKSIDRLKDQPHPKKSFRTHKEANMIVDKASMDNDLEKGDGKTVLSLTQNKMEIQNTLGARLENNPSDILLQKACMQFDASATLPKNFIEKLNSEGIKIVD
jgi:chromosome segregation ATPase